MDQFEKRISSFAWPLWIVLIATQILLSFFLYNQNGNQALRITGWVVWVLSCIFGLLPMYTLRRKGGVEKEQSYIKTTTLVTSGVFAIVRHPQYLSFMLLSLFFMLITQHWIVTALGITAIIIIYSGILPAADQLNIEKFGQDYQRYMQNVPKTNFILGIIRLLQRRKSP